MNFTNITNGLKLFGGLKTVPITQQRWTPAIKEHFSSTGVKDSGLLTVYMCTC